MLILSRGVNEAINIGDDIQLTVLGVRGGQVRIGIEAPRDVPVDREEIFLKKRREKMIRNIDNSIRASDYLEQKKTQTND